MATTTKMAPETIADLTLSFMETKPLSIVFLAAKEQNCLERARQPYLSIIAHFVVKVNLEVDFDGLARWLIFGAFDAAFLEHQLGGFSAVSVGVFVVTVNDFLDAGLNYSLGALVAREKCDVKFAAVHVGDAIQYCVQLSMADERIFSLEEFAFALPWHVSVVNAGWHAVIADRDDFVLVIYDTSTDARIWIFATLGGKVGDTHEVFIPGDIVFAHFHTPYLSLLYNRTMKIYSWNVNGLRAVLGKGALQSFVRDYAPDILCLQETKAQRGQAEVDLPEYEELWNSAERAGYSGTAIFTKVHPKTAIFTKMHPLSVRYDFPEEIMAAIDGWEDDFGDARKEGRVLTAEFEDFFLVDVYVPNEKDDLGRLKYRELVWDKALLAYMQQLDATKPVIVCGDFNVAHEEIDLARPKANEGHAGFTKEGRAGMTNYLRAGFIDTFRALHPEQIQYSWWSYRGGARAKNVGWRIDYFLASASLRDDIVAAEICDEVMGSDHCPILLELK